MIMRLLKSLILFGYISFHYYTSTQNILKIDSFKTSFQIYKNEILSQVFNYHIKDKNITHIIYQLTFYKTMNFYYEDYIPYFLFKLNNKDYVLEDFEIIEFQNLFELKIKMHQLDNPNYFQLKFLSQKKISLIHKIIYFLLFLGMFIKLLLNIIKQYILRNKSFISIYTQILIFDSFIIISIVIKIYQLYIYYQNKNSDLNNWKYKIILSFFTFFKKITQYILASFIFGLTYKGENLEFSLEILFTILFKTSGNFELNFKDSFLSESTLLYLVVLFLFFGIPLLTFRTLKKLNKLKKNFQNNIHNDQELYSDIAKTIEIKFNKIFSLTILFMILMIFFALLYSIKEKVHYEIYNILYFIVIIFFSCGIGYIYFPILLPYSYDTSLDILENIKIRRHNIFKVNLNLFNYKIQDIQKLIIKYEKDFNSIEEENKIEKYIPFLIINPFKKQENNKFNLINIEQIYIGKHIIN